MNFFHVLCVVWELFKEGRFIQEQLLFQILFYNNKIQILFKKNNFLCHCINPNLQLIANSKSQVPTILL
jgi:hypothetical protein